MGELKKLLTNVIWICGATDAGKSTVAQQLAEKHDLAIYHYDRFDIGHHHILAQSNPKYQKALAATLEERWVKTTPEILFRRWYQTCVDRFPLVLANFQSMPSDKVIVAEGFGVFPELISPLISNRNQVLCLVPTKAFKLDSFDRRGKPTLAHRTSDPDRHRFNLLNRDHLISNYYHREAKEHGIELVEVDITHSKNDVAALVNSHFEEYILSN